MSLGRTARARLVAGLRRPAGFIERTKWYFGLGSLLSLLLLLPEAGHDTTEASQLVILAVSVATLFVFVSHLYLTGRTPLLLDVVAAAAVLGFALVCITPEVAFSFAFPFLWFRIMYGSKLRVAFATVCIVGTFVLASILWQSVPGHSSSTPFAPIAATLPVMVLSAIFFRHLWARLTSYDGVRHRDAALAELGANLLRAQTDDDIRRCGRQAATAICHATTGLGIIIVHRDGDDLSVDTHTGEVGTVPERLPLSVLPDAMSGESITPLSLPVGLLELPDRGARWFVLELTAPRETWMLLRCPTGVVKDIASSVRSAANQVALAFQNSEAHRELDTQAHTDALTGLANRSAFTQALDATHAEPGSVVLFLDLDDFKHVNDGLGHASGDDLLCEIADRLASTVRSGDLCARLGGDEFAIILRGVTSMETATMIAQRIVDLVGAPVTLDSACAKVGASIGLAFGNQTLTAERLLQRADTAMYAAKNGGKNRYHVYDETLGGGADVERLGLLV